MTFLILPLRLRFKIRFTSQFSPRRKVMLGLEACLPLIANVGTDLQVCPSRTGLKTRPYICLHNIKSRKPRIKMTGKNANISNCDCRDRPSGLSVADRSKDPSLHLSFAPVSSRGVLPWKDDVAISGRRGVRLPRPDCIGARNDRRGLSFDTISGFLLNCRYGGEGIS